MITQQQVCGAIQCIDAAVCMLYDTILHAAHVYVLPSPLWLIYLLTPCERTQRHSQPSPSGGAKWKNLPIFPLFHNFSPFSWFFSSFFHFFPFFLNFFPFFLILAIFLLSGSTLPLPPPPPRLHNWTLYIMPLGFCNITLVTYDR